MSMFTETKHFESEPLSGWNMSVATGSATSLRRVVFCRIHVDHARHRNESCPTSHMKTKYNTATLLKIYPPHLNLRMGQQFQQIQQTATFHPPPPFRWRAKQTHTYRLSPIAFTRETRRSALNGRLYTDGSVPSHSPEKSTPKAFANRGGTTRTACRPLNQQDN